MKWAETTHQHRMANQRCQTLQSKRSIYRKQKGQMYGCHEQYLLIFTHNLAPSGSSRLLNRYPLPSLRLRLCSTVQLGSFSMASRARQATMIVKTAQASPFIGDITRGKSWKINLFQKPVGRFAKESFIDWPYFYSILLFFAKALHLGKSFSLLLITDCHVTPWKHSDRRHIAYLVCVSYARVLTKSVKIDQSEGIPDPGIPERPFVKFD